MIRAALALAAFVAVAAPAAAHDARPLSVVATERDDGQVELSWRAPGSVDLANAPTVRLGGSCAPVGGQNLATRRLDGRALYACAPGLADATFEFAYPLYNPSISTLVRIARATGEISTRILSPDVRTWAAPAPSTWTSVAANYFRLGVKHILIGVDHILFLFGLMLLARTPLRIVATVTGFTIAHSLTLALVALGAARVSVPAIEATIALSIVFVAAEIARNDRATLAARFPILVASTFGLLHGAGFAAVLGEIGLPQTERISALLSFNVGVEAGQLFLIAVILAAAGLWRAARRRIEAYGRIAPLPLPAEELAGLALGVLAAYWFFERAAAVFA